MNTEITLSRRDFIKLSGTGLAVFSAVRNFSHVEAKSGDIQIKEIGPDINTPCISRAVYRSEKGEFTIIGTENDDYTTSSGTFVSRFDSKFDKLNIPDNSRGPSDNESPRDIISLPNGHVLLLSDHVATRIDPNTSKCINIYDYKSQNDSSFEILTAVVYGDKLILGGKDLTQGLMSADLNKVISANSPSEVRWEWMDSLFNKVNPPNGLIIRSMIEDPVSGNLLLTALDGRYRYYEINQFGYFNFSDRSGTGVISLDKNLKKVDNPYNKNVDQFGNIPINNIYPFAGGIVLGNERPAKDKDGKRTTDRLIQIYDTSGNAYPDYQINSFGLIVEGRGNTVSLRGIQVVDNTIFVAINGGNFVSADLSVLKDGGQLNWNKVVTKGLDGQNLEAFGTRKSVNKDGNTEILIGRYSNGDNYSKPVLVTLPKV